MLIFCWNVAGFSTTVNQIHENYHPVIEKARPSAALAAYFAKHNADIVCIQEHKVNVRQLNERREPRQCSSVEGYESFWSCCVDQSKKGLNGVVTYAKKNTVLSADPAPLGSSDLDDQGRCIMTDHGHFVLYNVYVPASGGQPLAYKMKFLKALRRSMKHQRDVCKKKVILVGDLNISHEAKDIFWKNRVVHVQDILGEVAAFKAQNNLTGLPRWKLDLSKQWDKITAALETKEAVETQTMNPLTKEKHKKFRLAVMVNNCRVYLGKYEASPEHSFHPYDFSECSYIDSDSGETIVAQEKEAVSVGILTELMKSIAGVEWDEKMQRCIAQNASVRRLSPPRNWLSSLLHEDGMVDVFRHFYPAAEARFTCWNQFTNRRYENEGARIDFTLVDEELLHNVKMSDDGSTLRCCGGSLSEESSLSEAAALRAATANGSFQPVSFRGGGIQEASQRVLDTQFGPPHTGMIYTPPRYSDHIAISLLMKDKILQRNLVLDDKSSSTRKAQPHKRQRLIASFFSTMAATKTDQGTDTKRPKLTKPKSKKRKSSISILDHFNKHGK